MEGAWWCSNPRGQGQWNGPVLSSRLDFLLDKHLPSTGSWGLLQVELWTLLAALLLSLWLLSSGFAAKHRLWISDALNFWPFNISINIDILEIFEINIFSIKYLMLWHFFHQHFPSRGDISGVEKLVPSRTGCVSRSDRDLQRWAEVRFI